MLFRIAFGSSFFLRSAEFLIVGVGHIPIIAQPLGVPSRGVSFQCVLFNAPINRYW